MDLETTILSYLADLEGAVGNLGQTWHPDDPAYRADVYRQTMTSLSFSYFMYFHADAEHPDWAPLWNPVYTLQPNPDDIYLYSPIRGDLRYRVSGNRGTCKILSFTTQAVMSGTVDAIPEFKAHNEVDDTDLGLALGEDFEIIFSAERPAGYEGKWARIDPAARAMMLRFRSYDWLNEVDPHLSIECLDKVPPKPRYSPEQIIARIGEMAKFPKRKTDLYFAMQNAVKNAVGYNVFQPVKYAGALTKQVYWPACFQLDDDEALIIETDLPRHRPYWNIQLNDPYFNAMEYVYRLSSTNGHYAHVASDGRYYGVIALTDPGVPNWLDPAGYKEGGIYGRWYDCDSAPTPLIKRVKLCDLRAHLPADTPVVSEHERDEELRLRCAPASAEGDGNMTILEGLDFDGRVVVVTGGATGIGYASAEQFAQLGANVVIASRTASELEEAAERIRERTGARCLAVPTDVKDEAAVAALIERTIAEFGRIDVLVNNAGGTRMGPLESIPTKGWDAIFDLNVRSAYFCTREAGKHMIAQKSGAIINISSNAGSTGVKGGAHYSAAKSALQMFTKVTAAEWGRYGIRCNCVAAGMIASPRAASAWDAAGLDPLNMAQSIPLKRPGTPDEMANMIVFFASDAASYITGRL